MSVERVEVVPFALPLRRPYVTARGTLTRRELLLVRLHTSDGLTGLGETGPLALRGGPATGEIAAAIRDRYAPALIGAEPEPDALGELLDGLRRIRGGSAQALAGVDLALWDLAGKRAGKAVWDLLGAARPPEVTCNATLSTGSPAEVAGEALEWAELGFRSFKLKVGAGHDAEQVAAVREAVGTGARIRIDANASWTTHQAVAALRGMESLDIELCEQPVATLDGMAEVRGASAIPLAADESVTGPADARRAIDLGACDAVTVKVAKVGGIGAARAVIGEAPTYLSSALDGPLGIAAALHLAAVLPGDGFAAGLAHGLATARLFAATVAAPPGRAATPDASPPPGTSPPPGASPAPDDHGLPGGGAPVMAAPTGPGLGVDIDDGALGELRI